MCVGVFTAGRKTGKAAGSGRVDVSKVPAEMMSQFRAEPDVDMLGMPAYNNHPTGWEGI